MYTLVAEPQGLIIKKDKDMQGIRIEGKEGKKIFQYADDNADIKGFGECEGGNGKSKELW